MIIAVMKFSSMEPQTTLSIQDYLVQVDVAWSHFSSILLKSFPKPANVYSTNDVQVCELDSTVERPSRHLVSCHMYKSGYVRLSC